MYKIEYYKTKKKPELAKPILKKDFTDKELKGFIAVSEHYLRRKEIIEKTWNIKSLTLYKEDIYMLKYAENTSMLYLVAQMQRLSPKYEGIKFLNNNPNNENLIYDILNENWLLSEDALDNITDEDIAVIETKLEEVKNKFEEYKNEYPDKYYHNSCYKNEMKRYEYMLSCIKNKKQVEHGKVITKGINYIVKKELQK